METCAICGNQYIERAGQPELVCPICVSPERARGMFWGYEEVGGEELTDWCKKFDMSTEEAVEYCTEMRYRVLLMSEIQDAARHGYYPPGTLVRVDQSLFRVERRVREHKRIPRRRCDLVYLRQDTKPLCIPVAREDGEDDDESI